jgi:hypothetical protein
MQIIITNDGLFSIHKLQPHVLEILIGITAPAWDVYLPFHAFYYTEEYEFSFFSNMLFYIVNILLVCIIWKYVFRKHFTNVYNRRN